MLEKYFQFKLIKLKLKYSKGPNRIIELRELDKRRF